MVLTCNVTSVDILDSGGFLVWTTLSRGWAFTAAAFIILAPLLQVTNTMHLKLELSMNLRELFYLLCMTGAAGGEEAAGQEQEQAAGGQQRGHQPRPGGGHCHCHAHLGWDVLPN